MCVCFQSMALPRELLSGARRKTLTRLANCQGNDSVAKLGAVLESPDNEGHRVLGSVLGSPMYASHLLKPCWKLSFSLKPYTANSSCLNLKSPEALHRKLFMSKSEIRCFNPQALDLMPEAYIRKQIAEGRPMEEWTA